MHVTSCPFGREQLAACAFGETEKAARRNHARGANTAIPRRSEQLTPDNADSWSVVLGVPSSSF
jgi:hypothetical protein